MKYFWLVTMGVLLLGTGCTTLAVRDECWEHMRPCSEIQSPGDPGDSGSPGDSGPAAAAE